MYKCSLLAKQMFVVDPGDHFLRFLAATFAQSSHKATGEYSESTTEHLFEYERTFNTEHLIIDQATTDMVNPTNNAT